MKKQFYTFKFMNELSRYLKLINFLPNNFKTFCLASVTEKQIENQNIKWLNT